MTQLEADFAAKGLLNLMTSSPVATGLAHQHSSYDFIKFSLGERCPVVHTFESLKANSGRVLGVIKQAFLCPKLIFKAV